MSLDVSMYVLCMALFFFFCAVGVGWGVERKDGGGGGLDDSNRER